MHDLSRQSLEDAYSAAGRDMTSGKFTMAEHVVALDAHDGCEHVSAQHSVSPKAPDASPRDQPAIASSV
jgi:hypothetical protein